VSPFHWTSERLPAAAGGLSACRSGGATSEVARAGIGGKRVAAIACVECTQDLVK
jgi:hypothetical protein